MYIYKFTYYTNTMIRSKLPIKNIYNNLYVYNVILIVKNQALVINILLFLLIFLIKLSTTVICRLNK